MKTISILYFIVLFSVNAYSQNYGGAPERIKLQRYDSTIDYDLLYLLPNPKNLIGQRLEFSPINKEYNHDTLRKIQDRLSRRLYYANQFGPFQNGGDNERLYLGFTTNEEQYVQSLYEKQFTSTRKIDNVIVIDHSRILDQDIRRPIAEALLNITTNTYKPSLFYDGHLFVATPYAQLAGKSFLIKDVNLISQQWNTDYGYTYYVFNLIDEDQKEVTYVDQHFTSPLKQAIHIQGFLKKAINENVRKHFSIDKNRNDSVQVHVNPYYIVDGIKNYITPAYNILASEKWVCKELIYVGFIDAFYKRPVLVFENKKKQVLYVKLKDFPDRQQQTNDTFFIQSIEAFDRLD
jgi:hypothetical protein